jgi:hypothetical protein
VPLDMRVVGLFYVCLIVFSSMWGTVLGVLRWAGTAVLFVYLK